MAILAGALAFLWVLAYPVDVSVLSPTAKVLFWIGIWPLLVWLIWRTYNRLLWHVSGRLAFSYFLIGVVPIPLVLALVLIIAYGFTGFYLSRVFQQTTDQVERELALAAESASAASATGSIEPVAIAIYENGERAGGDERAPARWPFGDGDGSLRDPIQGLWLELEDGRLTLAAAPTASTGGTTRSLAFFDGDAEAMIRRRSGMWAAIADEARRRSVRVRGVAIQVGSTDEDGDRGAADDARLETDRRSFFAASAPEDPGFLDRPFFTWVTGSEQPLLAADGTSRSDGVGVILQATPRMVARSLFGTQAELVQGFWVALLVASILLLTIYALAELVAVSMIVGLSRAVSRLYGATRSVAAGDFSVRIPVRRRDQVGAVQRSFNAMAENLEDLVSTAAQKELLEKELQIARQVQQSLIPQNLPASDRVEFSTLFEPSAAIGGDYFDVLRLSEHELAVVVADVSGHGLPTGLRMAMVKAALGILVLEAREADEVLRRLDATVRSGHATGDQARFFVTAVFSRIDFAAGAVEITNAGHPPVYLLRAGAVDEILLPGSPLGGLGQTYGRRRVDLQDGDVLVWLSDGLIEAVGRDDEPFGYERTIAAIAGPAETAAQVRDRLLAAIDAHTEGRPASDDRTLVVMRYST